MFWAGLTLVSVLSLLACAASIAVTVRVRFEGRAESAMAAIIVWNAIVLSSIYGLGSCHRLTAPWLACTSAALSGVVFFAALGKRRKERARETWRTFLRFVRMPSDGLRLAWRAGSLVWFGLLFALMVVAYETFASYWLPSWRGWDALWYHEPIVGWAIQTHSLQVIDLPLLNGVQKLNGYPKVAEMTALWFTIFTDRRLIDLQSCLVGLLMILSMYALARRVSEDKVTSMGWGAAMLLMPATTQELQSLYIDNNFAWVTLATLLFATPPVMRMRHAVICALSATLLVGTKPQGLILAPIILVIALIRLLASKQYGWRPVFAVSAFATVLVGGMAASVYLRNYLVFHNPFWPDLKLDIPKYNIHWPGIFEPNEPGMGSKDGLDLNLPWSQFFKDAYSASYSWTRWHYHKIHDYGFGVIWLVWPLATIAGILAVLGSLRHLLSGVFVQPRWRVSRETRIAAFVVVPIVIAYWLSTARWSSRYHNGTAAMMMMLCAWVSGRGHFRRLTEGVVAVTILGGIAGNFWCERFWVGPVDLVKLMEIPYPARESSPAKAFTDSWMTIGSCVTTEAGVAREREQVSGSVLAFPTSFGNFPSIFWNDHFSNKIIWIPDGPDFIAQAEQAHATWIYMTHADPMLAALKADPQWEVVAVANIENWGSFYRKVK